MTARAVGVVGYDHIGKRVADAIAAQPDMQLAGVYETEPRRVEMIAARGLPLADGNLAAWAASCAAVAFCMQGEPDLAVPTVFGPQTNASCSLFGLGRDAPTGNRVRVPCADAVALARLLAALPRAERLFSSCARRAGHATDRLASIDALEPLFELSDEDDDIESLLTPMVPSVFIRRTQVSYSHSHLHHVKVDLAAPTTVNLVLASLCRMPRLHLARGEAGFFNTAQVQEYYRDLGRPRGDRSEVFVWEESVAVVEKSLFLVADINPDSVAVPELVDAVRHFLRPELPFFDASSLTDQSLAIAR
jgi:glyceraldehyde-3-phosphate dehydrogenase (NAD(P))